MIVAVREPNWQSVSRRMRTTDEHTASGRTDIAELARLISRHSPYDGLFPLSVSGIDVYRSSRVATGVTHALQQAAVCILAQGAKSIGIGDSIYEYRAAQVAVFSIDVPVAVQVTRATPAEPYLVLRIALDSEKVSTLAGKVYPHGLPQVFDGRTVYIDDADPAIVDAVSWLRTNYERPVDIEELASLVNVSLSSFHRQFKAVTSMSPLQYQKALRLQEARRLMLTTRVDAASASRRVGYVSASQFSREYARFFGAAPMKDIQRLRGQS
jgi:AraC-like DNA-binding protein